MGRALGSLRSRLGRQHGVTDRRQEQTQMAEVRPIRLLRLQAARPKAFSQDCYANENERNIEPSLFRIRTYTKRTLRSRQAQESLRVRPDAVQYDHSAPLLLNSARLV